ncbi:hypothetical protein [Streptomyces aquilus]|uniref:hypothetical protein n=1 Tax=Streptomyces aquilus TaxID=2548456 RepID=UPI003694BDC2
MRRVKHYGGTEAGLYIVNGGLGTAVVTRSVVRLDGEVLGEWNYQTYLLLSDSLPVSPKAYSLRSGALMLAGQSNWLLTLEEFIDGQHDWFWDLITRRLVIEIFYDSVYGGENFSVTPPAI